MLWKVWKRFQQHDARLQQVENDIYYCWRQVAGEDEYIAQQSSRIDVLHNQVMMCDGRLVEMEENYSMDHDYIMGLHYALLENGGFVRFTMGVEAPYLMSMTNQERGNLLAHSTMGAASYMELVR